MHTGTKPSNEAFHFIKGDKLRDGSTAPPNGKWLKYKGPIVICKSGLHASYRVADALIYARGNTLCLVELDGIVDTQCDKVVASKRKIIARFDATELLRADARASALSVIKNWKSKVPQVVLDWLTTGDESLRAAAESAAESATRPGPMYAAMSAAISAATYAAAYAAISAATYAAKSAATYAAKPAAWPSATYAAYAADSAAEERLHNAVMAKFVEMGVLKS